jgi:putative flippase GtrA
MSKTRILYKQLVNINTNGIYKVMPKYFLGYLFAGITAVLTLLTIQATLLNIFNVEFIITQIVGTCCAIFVSFTINNLFTFKKNNKKRFSKKIIQFFVTNISSMVLNVLIANFIFEILEIWYLASITGILFAVIFNYFIYRYKIWN